MRILYEDERKECVKLKGEWKDGPPTSKEVVPETNEQTLRSTEHGESYGDHIDRRLVHFDFVKFVTVDETGLETDDAPILGYLAYNGYTQEFGTKSFQGSDSYTKSYDILQHLRSHHERLADAVDMTGGFLLSGQWVTPTSNETHH